MHLCEYFKVDVNILTHSFTSKRSNGTIYCEDLFPMFKSKSKSTGLGSLMNALGVTYESICDLEFTNKDLKQIGVTSKAKKEMFFSRLRMLLSVLKSLYKEGEGELVLNRNNATVCHINNPIEVNNPLEPNNENNGNVFQSENDAPDFDDSVETNNVQVR